MEFLFMIQDIVFRVTNQDNTRERIKQQEQEKLRTKEQLLNHKEQLKTEFETIKFTSQQLLAQ